MAHLLLHSPLLTRRKALGLLAASALGVALPGSSWAAASGQNLAASGQILLSAGNTAEAVAVLREAAKAEPANPWVWNLLGRGLMQLGEPAQAAQAFRSALRADAADGYSQMMLDMLSQKPLSGPESKPGSGGAAAGTAGAGSAAKSGSKPGASPGRAPGATVGTGPAINALPGTGPGTNPGPKKRPSHLEEQAKAELQAFLATGQAVQPSRLVLLDPGHGGADPGVTGPGGLVEKDFTLDLAKRIAAALDELGHRAVLTREADYAVPLWARTAMIDLYRADVFVSLHATAAETAPTGVDVFSYSTGTEGARATGVMTLENGVMRFERQKAPPAPPLSAIDLLGGWKGARLQSASKELAADLSRTLKLPPPLDKVNAGAAALAVLQSAGAAAVLVEAGYLSNPAQEAALKKTDVRRDLALSLAKALAG